MPLAHKIPWLRLSTEATAIIISILVAFAIDAWWEDVQQTRHLQSVLKNLEAGFSANLNLIDENRESVMGDQEHLRRFIEMDPHDDAAQIPAESTFDTLQAIWRPGTWDGNYRSLLTTLDSENLTLLHNPSLIEAISDWRADVDERDERAEQLAENERESLRALGHHSGVGIVLAKHWGEPRSLDGNVMRQVREDQEVMALAARKVFWAKG